MRKNWLNINFGWYSDHPKKKNGYDFAFNFIPDLAVSKEGYDDDGWQLTIALSWLFFVVFVAIVKED